MAESTGGAKEAKFLQEINVQARSPIHFGVICLILCLVPLVVSNEYYLHVLISIFYHIIYASTYRFILRTGQFHFGAHAFIGIGAYSSALLVTKLGLSFWLAMPIAGLISATCAILVGYPTLRLKGIYFAIITWGLGDTLRFLYIRFESLFGGALGIFSIPEPDSFPFFSNIDFSQKSHFYVLSVLLMMFTLYILYRMEKSRLGLIFGAVREGDKLARSLGINIMNYKVLAFAVCSGLAAMAGSFYAHYTYYISPKDFSILLTIYLAIYTIVGGKENFYGCIIGTSILMLAGEIFAGYAHYQLLMYSGLLILIILFLPNGLVSIYDIIGRLFSSSAKSTALKDA